MDQHRVGAFLQDEQRLWELLTLTGSLRLDYNSLSDPWTVSPRLAAVARLSQTQFARLAFGMAFRKPSFFNTSIHISDVQEVLPGVAEFFERAIGNPDLSNEGITSFEAGYHGRFLGERLVVEADAFANLYRDTIVFLVDIQTTSLGTPDLRRSSASYQNTGRDSDSLGGALALTWRIGKRWRLHGNYSYRYTFYTTDPGTGDPTGQYQKGDRVPTEPEHLANLGLQYLPDWGLRFGLSLRFSSAQSAVVSTGGAFDDRTWIEEPAQAVISGFLAWRFQLGDSWLETGLKLFNLMDARIHELPGSIGNGEVEFGGVALARRMMLFVRGAL
jgi:outer membrane receptor for ferrienterochelin and colicin